MTQPRILWAANKLLSKSWFRMAIAVAVAILCALPIAAQSKPADEKPPMYGYVAFWSYPRDKWIDVEKTNSEPNPVMQKALSSGSLIAYGTDDVMVHSVDGPTHDSWWASTSIAGVVSTLEQARAAALSSDANVRNSAAKHWDNFVISHYYNWKPGTYKGAFTRVGYFRLKPEAADDGLKTLAVNGFVPMFEKLLASGALIEYEIDEEYVHTENPAGFWVVTVCPNAEGLDKVASAVQNIMKDNPLFGSAAGGMIDWPSHRDYLSRTNATFK